MSWLMRTRNLWRRDRLENDIRDELQSHVEMRSDDNIPNAMLTPRRHSLWLNKPRGTCRTASSSYLTISGTGFLCGARPPS